MVLESGAMMSARGSTMDDPCSRGYVAWSTEVRVDETRRTGSSSHSRSPEMMHSRTVCHPCRIAWNSLVAYAEDPERDRRQYHVVVTTEAISSMVTPERPGDTLVAAPLSDTHAGGRERSERREDWEEC